MVDGRVIFTLNSGDDGKGSISVTNSVVINNSKEHELTVTRTPTQARLKVAGVETVEDIPAGYQLGQMQRGPGIFVGK